MENWGETGKAEHSSLRTATAPAFTFSVQRPRNQGKGSREDRCAPEAILAGYILGPCPQTCQPYRLLAQVTTGEDLLPLRASGREEDA